MSGAPSPQLQELRACFEGAIPGVMATCGDDGTPNVAYISQVYYVDERHVALSFQFFNKTRQNILANRHATVLVLHPATAAFYRLHIRYLRTETAGPLFEGMKAQLAGIASHSGMGGVFVLRGADVYEVQGVEALEGPQLPAPARRGGRLAALRQLAERLARATSLDELLSLTLATLADAMGMRHAMVLLREASSERLYTVASSGYATSGVGSEIEAGRGVIGVAAREATPVRIGHMTNAYLYSRAVRRSLRASGMPVATDIPYPGLAEPHSQLAVPIVSGGHTLGVLFVESPEDLAFGFEDEDMLVAAAAHLGAAMGVMQALGTPEPAYAPPAAPAAPAAHARVPLWSGDGSAVPPGAAPLLLRRFRANDSVFIGETYLIKGVAGAIFWKLLGDYTQHGRTAFSNRELRVDPAIRLPDVADNLEARLLLLQRRLQENSPDIRIEKTGRGLFRLVVARPVVLEDVAS